MKTNLKQLRKRAGWNNADDFAASIGMPAKTYRNYEQGIRKMGLDVACEICNALKCELSELVAPPIYYGVVALEDAEEAIKLEPNEIALIKNYRRCNNDIQSVIRTMASSMAGVPDEAEMAYRAAIAEQEEEYYREMVESDER